MVQPRARLGTEVRRSIEVGNESAGSSFFTSMLMPALAATCRAVLICRLVSERLDSMSRPVGTTGRWNFSTAYMVTSRFGSEVSVGSRLKVCTLGLSSAKMFAVRD